MTVTDVIPLFHERVMACSTEIAFEMIEAHLQGQPAKNILGVYDAPIKYKNQDGSAVPLSQVALLLGEQIKNKYDVLDSVIVSLRINDDFEDGGS